MTLDDVREFLRGRLTGYKIPHHVNTNAIPRNASGEVLKHRLREGGGLAASHGKLTDGTDRGKLALRAPVTSAVRDR